MSDPMREEVRRIYGRLCPEQNSRHIPMPEPVTVWERKRLAQALRRSEHEHIQLVLARTGSIAQAMAECRTDYATVREAMKASA